jgi:hypothetical protein
MKEAGVDWMSEYNYEDQHANSELLLDGGDKYQGLYLWVTEVLG